MEVAATVLASLVALGLLAWGGILAWRGLQLCPHCAWIVKRAQHGWLRCSRCHRQYGRK